MEQVFLDGFAFFQQLMFNLILSLPYFLAVWAVVALIRFFYDVMFGNKGL